MPSVDFHTIRSGVRGPGPSLYLLHGASRLVATNKSLAQITSLCWPCPKNTLWTRELRKSFANIPMHTAIVSEIDF